MTRLLIHVEGETEEQFVNEVLSGHLLSRGYESVSARLFGNARQRYRRGGARAWSAVKKEIVSHLKQDRGALASTMVDYYGMPQTGPKAWPARAEAATRPLSERAGFVESAMRNEIVGDMGNDFPGTRFVPFVLMHEFEALLFSDCETFGTSVAARGEAGNLANDMRAIREQFDTPEDINDSPVTAPSKRISDLYPQYNKPLHGVLAALDIGLERMRSECPHFDTWLRVLESQTASA